MPILQRTPRDVQNTAHTGSLRLDLGVGLDGHRFPLEQMDYSRVGGTFEVPRFDFIPVVDRIAWWVQNFGWLVNFWTKIVSPRTEVGNRSARRLLYATIWEVATAPIRG